MRWHASTSESELRFVLQISFRSDIYNSNLIHAYLYIGLDSM